MDIVYILRNFDDCEQYCNDAADEIERLREALLPFTRLFLYPDDFGEFTAKEVRSDEDWNEEQSDETIEEVFVYRKWIKEARKAMGM